MAKQQPQIKTAPHSKESEMMVLGCMLTSVNSLNIGSDLLNDTDFYFTEHKIIFKTLQETYKKDKPADIHIVGEELKRINKLDAVGGISYLTTLAQYAGTSAFVEEYAQIIKDKAILRQMIEAAQIIEKTAIEEAYDVPTILDEAQSKFFHISQVANKDTGILLKDVISGIKAKTRVPYLQELQEKQEQYQKRGEDDLGLTGIPTHFIDLDKMLNGFSGSNLMILAARPAMGKTAFALNIAENICFKNKIPVALFSLEMSTDQVVHRMICSQAEVESEKILKGSLNGIEYQRVVAAANSMMKHTMIIDDQPGLKITDLRARARRLKESYDVGFVIIDYLQLISGSGTLRSTENRQNEISEISRMLKTLARELNVPILCLSQLSRRVEERQGHRPMMSDLRESGSIEQDSDLVMFLLRREYYDPYDKPGQAELIIGKNRHGPIGSVNLSFRKEIAQFANYSTIDSSSEFKNEEAFADFSPDM
jgi:replicative DNA helicase